MSASYRTSTKNTSRHGDSSSDTRRKPTSSRIPTKADDTGSKSKSPRHVSKLAKKVIRGTTLPDRAEQTTRTAATGLSSSTSKSHRLVTPDPPAAVPRSEPALSTATSTAPTYRHPLPLPPNIRTPSLISGSSASTFDSPRSNVLRKKPSTLDHYASQKRAYTTPTEMDRTDVRNDDYSHEFDDTVLGITLPPTQSISTTLLPTPPPLDTVYDHGRSVQYTTPPIPTNQAPSMTPSTRYTDSPFSHVPTPSSTSSYSPAVVATTGPYRQPYKASASRPVENVDTARQSGVRSDSQSVRRSSASLSTNVAAKPTASHQPPPRKDSLKSEAGASVPSYAKPTASSARNSRSVVQIPPELAHLNVDPPPRPANTQKPLPPIRPSRDGTPNISDMSPQTRVVQSDLPVLYTTYHKRTPSQETPVSATSPAAKQRFGIGAKASPRHTSPRIDSAISPPPSARKFSRATTPDQRAADSQRVARKDTPAVGVPPSPSKSPRFGFFSRKSKVDVNKPTEKPKRPPTKGPTAGTGHEGYGRFGLRGRSGSSVSSTGGLRSPSADSSTSSLPRPATTRKASLGSSRGDESEHEEFLRERQSPVILRGSGSTFSNAGSISDLRRISTVGSSNSSTWDSYPPPRLLPSAMTSGVGTSPVKGTLRGQIPSESSEDDVTARYPELSVRRSVSRFPPPPSSLPLNSSATPSVVPSPKHNSVDSHENDPSAWRETDSTLPGANGFAAEQEGMWLRRQPSEAVKHARKWNFFQRAQASPRPKGKQRIYEEDDLVLTRQRPGVNPAIAHYAMVDLVEPVDLHEVEQILQEPETSADDSAYENPRASRIVPYDARHSSYLPAPPQPEYSRDADFRAKPTPPRIMVRQDAPQSPSPELVRAQAAIPQSAPKIVDAPKAPTALQIPGDLASSREEPTQLRLISTPDLPGPPHNTPDKTNDGSPRQPRLSPVGRIPRVVSKRDRDRKLPDNSFSRPFARTQPHPSVKPPGALYNQIRELASPVDSGSQPVSSTSTKSEGILGERKSSAGTNPPSISTNRTSVDAYNTPEFISFTRKGSEVSYSSSSGNTSWIAAISAPPMQMDDPWAEYNDLLDDMMPQHSATSIGSSLGAPFQYAHALYDPYSPSVPLALNCCLPPVADLPLPPRSHTVPAVLSVPQQVSRFMKPSLSPLRASMDLTDPRIQRDRQSTTQAKNKRSSLPQARRMSTAPVVSTVPTANSTPAAARSSVASSRHSRTSTHSRSTSLPEANVRNSTSSLTSSARLKRDTQLLGIAEDDVDGQAAQANLRFAALMTSKWLSFGQVLFSPAHNEMRFIDDPKVLVIDGLGSDWSYYVALTYPQAQVFNLAVTPASSTSSWPGINQTPPPNHKHYPLASLTAAFPFPKGFFTAVLFRFPIATTDAAYQACIYECKRVLRPGGYLEVAVLDLDLMNMGSRTRNAVRGLKTRMQLHDPQVSLQNLSDLLLRHIGKRGFEEIQRCVVGVPAAGQIPHSQDHSSRSSEDSSKPKPRPSDHRASSTNEVSFAKLLSDASLDPTNANNNSSDESITKMVAKVGRWWYSTCYETSLLPTDRSIWRDQALLRECQKQGTSFRLLICHAQKPLQTRRRTVSL